MAKARIGAVKVSNQLILELLGYPEGHLHGARKDNFSAFGMTEFLVEDLTMPLVEEGSILQTFEKE